MISEASKKIEPNELPQKSTSEVEQEPRLHRMWVPVVLFFFQFAAIGVFFTFLNVYYREAGMSGTQIGILNMANSLVSVVGTFMWGYFSDRTGKPSYLIAAGSLVALLVAQFIPYVPMLHLVNPFWVYILLAGLGSLAGSVSGTLVDSTTLAMLGNRREDYGKYRLGGSVGYIIATLTAGALFQNVGLRWMFPSYGLIMLFFCVVALFLPHRSVHLTQGGGGEIGSMLRQPAWLIFIITTFLVWIAYYGAIMFTSVILKSMGAGDQLISFAVVIGAVVEMPFMFFSNQLIKRFGAARLVWVAIFLQVLRFFLLSRMTDPVWAIAINTLNGPGFVLFWNGAMNHLSRLAPPGLLGTAQGMFSSTTNLAGIISSLISGVLFDQIGPSGLFLVMSVCCAAAFILFGAGTVLRPQAQTVAPMKEPGH